MVWGRVGGEGGGQGGQADCEGVEVEVEIDMGR